jgi:hypothetical protein
MAAPDERDTRQRDHPPLLEKDEPGHPASYWPTAIHRRKDDETHRSASSTGLPE